jgi:hypothetical protein
LLPTSDVFYIGNTSLQKKPRRLLRDKTSDEAGKENITAPPANLIEYNSIKIEKIGDLTPVQDFEAMISRRDSPDWVLKAIKDMENKIFGMVEDSHEGDNYPKALECLVALRKGCILEQVIHLPSSCTQNRKLQLRLSYLLLINFVKQQRYSVSEFEQIAILL